ncbi:TIGR00266 family protein [Halostella litorea]|uniref:TIGR00266 family protein n=1 Tax=Halostella litorea TaxID=2528831 RepID=UPI00109336B3|nr:TIGR00266 family protein [Halostella litorea]
MDHEVRHRPSFALLDVSLERGESITAEAGAMVSHSDGIDITTDRGDSGGFLQSVKRSMFGGESFFRNTFEATERGHVTLAPPLPGDVVHRELTSETLYVQSGSYLAADRGMELDTKFGGARTFFGGEGLFLLELTGTGDAFLSSYGAVEPVSLDVGETYVVDTGHIVAFEDGLSFDVRKVGGLKSTLFSGEGFVCEFEGPGTVWLQSRSQDAFLSWLVPQLPSGGGDGDDDGVQFSFG